MLQMFLKAAPVPLLPSLLCFYYACNALQEADTMLDSAKEDNVAFLVVGDPFG